jgi:hypothetical protein
MIRTEPLILPEETSSMKKPSETTLMPVTRVNIADQQKKNNNLEDDDY